jgi:hypothetical protein
MKLLDALNRISDGISSVEVYNAETTEYKGTYQTHYLSDDAKGWCLVNDYRFFIFPVDQEAEVTLTKDWLLKDNTGILYALKAFESKLIDLSLIHE